MKTFFSPPLYLLTICKKKCYFLTTTFSLASITIMFILQFYKFWQFRALSGVHLSKKNLPNEKIRRSREKEKDVLIKDKQKDRQTDGRTYRQTDRKTGRQKETDTQTDRQADKQAWRQANRQTGRLTCRQTERHKNRQADM